MEHSLERESINGQMLLRYGVFAKWRGSRWKE